MAMTFARKRSYHLVIAFAATAGFLLLVRLLPSLRTADEPQLIVKCVAEIGFAVLLLLVLVRLGERPQALGLRRIRPATFGWGLLCFFISGVLSALVIFVLSKLGIEQQRGMVAALASRPVPLMLLIAATAGIAEEIIFRSILITELEAGSGSRWLAAVVSLAIFALAHAPGWGPWQVVFAAVPGAVLTIFFIWKRDLWICILGHFLTDGVGFLSAAAALPHHS